MDPAAILSASVAALLFLALAGAALVSRLEGERRASMVFALLAIVLPLPWTVAALLPSPHGERAALLLFVPAAGACLLFLFPRPLRGGGERVTPGGRIDERVTIFCRRRLEPGTERFEEYYRRHPEHREADDRWRAKPGLMEEGTAFHDPVTFAAARASFDTVDAFHPLLETDSTDDVRVDLPPERITRFLKEWALQIGARSAGVTELKDVHLYSHVGRGASYGEPVLLDHTHAFAFTVEMEKSMVDLAPRGPTLMESARRYLDSGAIAVQLAQFLKGLGYRARAHIDGNYRVVCPLVARDAGLGEIGRMGILMTPALGPRVRIAVVTTDFPLVPDRPARDETVLDFCERCRKCADICPSRAISFGDRAEIDGALRWKIDQEACFTYWCVAGTDCARCMRVCPYSHPDNGLHRLVRWGIRNNPLFRRLALPLDDLIYGRKPPSLSPPGWLSKEE